MIPFNPERSAFGRHETFPLRFGWLTKGFAAWQADQGVFEHDDATVELGVGKNMVSAIRYWMTAAQVLALTSREVCATEIGERLFEAKGWDPYLEDDATIWLVHWLIASNASEATSIFWFFNRFHKPEFTSSELQAALADFVARDVRTRASASTIKHDVPAAAGPRAAAESRMPHAPQHPERSANIPPCARRLPRTAPAS